MGFDPQLAFDDAKSAVPVSVERGGDVVVVEEKSLTAGGGILTGQMRLPRLRSVLGINTPSMGAVSLHPREWDRRPGRQRSGASNRSSSARRA